MFAAGLSMRRIEREESDLTAPPDVVQAGASVEEQATAPETAPAYMARAVLNFNEQLERLGELAVVLVLGRHAGGRRSAGSRALAGGRAVRRHQAGGDAGHARFARRCRGTQRAFIAWFGVRGVGSIITWRTR